MHLIVGYKVWLKRCLDPRNRSRHSIWTTGHSTADLVENQLPFHVEVDLSLHSGSTFISMFIEATTANGKRIGSFQAAVAVGRIAPGEVSMTLFTKP
jgi:hypothetical protein